MPSWSDVVDSAGTVTTRDEDEDDPGLVRIEAQDPQERAMVGVVVWKQGNGETV